MSGRKITTILTAYNRIYILFLESSIYSVGINEIGRSIYILIFERAPDSCKYACLNNTSFWQVTVPKLIASFEMP